MPNLHDPSEMLSPHFFRCELSCRCCDKIGPYPENLVKLVAALERLRALAEAPVHVDCAYRCPAHNRLVGGVKNSYHCQDMAADIYVEGMTVDGLAGLARQAGFTGIGIYRGKHFVHADIGPAREWEE